MDSIHRQSTLAPLHRPGQPFVSRLLTKRRFVSTFVSSAQVRAHFFREHLHTAHAPPDPESVRKALPDVVLPPLRPSESSGTASAEFQAGIAMFQVQPVVSSAHLPCGEVCKGCRAAQIYGGMAHVVTPYTATHWRPVFDATLGLSPGQLAPRAGPPLRRPVLSLLGFLQKALARTLVGLRLVAGLAGPDVAGVVHRKSSGVAGVRRF